MAVRKTNKILDDELDKTAEAPVEMAKPGIVKEFVQNGMRYQRVRKEDGSTVDVRIG